MRTYLLDTNIISYFLNGDHLAELSRMTSVVQLALVDEVRTELEGHPTRGSTFLSWLPGSGLKVIEIVVGSPAHTKLLALSPALSARRGRGERASIAVAAVDPELVFVANDKNALWLALRELHSEHSRIIGVFTFLRWCREQAALSLGAIDDVAKASGAGRPSWWPEWRVALESSR